MKASISIDFSLRRDLKRIAAAGQGKTLAKRLNAAVLPLEKNVRIEARTLPKGGGYAAVMSKSVRARATAKADRLTALIAVRIYGAGAKERRDIVRIDKGTLRHPVFGRSRRIRRGVRAGSRDRNPWAVTSVRPGFVKRPIDKVGPAVGVAGRLAVDDILRELKG